MCNNCVFGMGSSILCDLTHSFSKLSKIFVKLSGVFRTDITQMKVKLSIVEIAGLG